MLWFRALAILRTVIYRGIGMLGVAAAPWLTVVFRGLVVYGCCGAPGVCKNIRLLWGWGSRFSKMSMVLSGGEHAYVNRRRLRDNRFLDFHLRLSA